MVKTKNLVSLKKAVASLKKKGKTIVFTNGCFDLIHPGHIKILKEAKKCGDILIVGLNSDSSVKKNKAKDRPILNQKARQQILEAICYVDYLLIFKEKTPYQAIKAIVPDVLVKGKDWPSNKIIGRQLVKKVIQIKLSPAYSTTKIINQIKKNG